MAVAEKNVTETTPRSATTHLAVVSLLGTAYLYLAILAAFHGVPAVWDLVTAPLGLNAFVSGALKFFLVIGAATVAAWLGYRLLLRHEVRGTRAGIFTLALGIFVALWLFSAIGGFMETRELGVAVGLVITAIVPAALLFLLYRFAFSLAFCQWTGKFEDQGWYHARHFKASQGVKVRRGTIIALLTLGGCGIYTMITHGWLRGASDWILPLPFTTTTVPEGTSSWGLYVLPDLRYSVPLLLIGLMAWMAWRIVNWPAFADFLIATEAEMNKVSWTTRKRLVQDTIVVLVTVFLLTVFLFVIDILWIRVLSAPWVSVLQIDPMKERAKLKEQSQW
jgi:preprotein translocase SecE subunit